MKILAYIFSALLLLIQANLAEASSRAAEKELEYKVKAAFLINFARFISWPETSFVDDDAPFSICILGEDPFGKAFSGIEGKSIQGRKIQILQCNNPQKIPSCHLLYINLPTRGELQQSLQTISSNAIATISDLNNAASLGVIFELIKIDGRLSFKINNSKAKEVRLNVDASLLDLATEVY